MTMRIACAVVVASAALGLAQPCAGQTASVAEIKARIEVAPYLDLVSTYRRGDFTQAAQSLLVWDSATVKTAVATMRTLSSRVASPPGVPDDLDLADVEAAVLLHCDAALLAWEEGRGTAVSLHMDMAVAILAWIQPFATDRVNPSVPRLDHRDVYLSMALLLTGRMEADSSLSLLRIALERYPDDAQLLLAQGTAREQAARIIELNARQVTVRGAREQFAASSLTMSAAELLRSAEQGFRRVLKLDPAMAEARLRLGRVLAKIGRAAEAESELRLLLSATSDAYLRYLGSMFLGRILESEGRLIEAESRYGDALKLQPGCQACRVALAHALDGLGDQKAAEMELIQVFEGRKPKDDAADPWWIYPYGQLEAGKQLSYALRASVLKK